MFVMVNIIIVHGTGGSPEGNWFPWLKGRLEKLGCRVFVPKFPTPENQSLDNWMKAFEGYAHYLDEGSIVVGHSLGPAFLLSVLEKYDVKIRAAFFVAGFAGLLGNTEFDTLNRTFVDKKFDWEKIRRSCKKFYVINSDRDPYVPIEKGESLAKNLGVELTVLKDAGHINSESGYTKFDMLLGKIKNELKS